MAADAEAAAEADFGLTTAAEAADATLAAVAPEDADAADARRS